MGGGQERVATNEWGPTLYYSLHSAQTHMVDRVTTATLGSVGFVIDAMSNASRRMITLKSHTTHSVQSDMSMKLEINLFA